jgi:ribosomal protein S12 methylthiotransferase accessory factor YcaO
MRLSKSPKYAGKGSSRAVPPGDTWNRVRPLLDQVGITRLADITGLDRIGIPTYSAIMPDTPDAISVYNGKGATRRDAKVSAIMEALERYSALHLCRPLTMGSYANISQERSALDPGSLIQPMHPEYSPEKEMAWIEGFDLIQCSPVLVPAQAVSIHVLPTYGQLCYTITTTNGLASGNTLEEAVCHGLCEVIERDAWTLAELRARFLPLMLRRLRSREAPDSQPDPNAEFDDIDAFPNIDLRGVGAPISRLMKRFQKAGLNVRLKHITSDLGIPTILATVAETIGLDFPMAHIGLGTHPDARIAMSRALTELAQCRAVDIQGAREDISEAFALNVKFPSHAQRVKRVRDTSWHYCDSTTSLPWRKLPHYAHADILEDIELMLMRLRGAGLERAIAIALTQPDLGIPVVRVLIPGLESWAGDDGRIGPRAEAYWRSSETEMRSKGL